MKIPAETKAHAVRLVTIKGRPMAEVADELGVVRQSVWNWCNAAKAITRQRCPKCGRAISHTCRPQGE